MSSSERNSHSHRHRHNEGIQKAQKRLRLSAEHKKCDIILQFHVIHLLRYSDSILCAVTDLSDEEHTECEGDRRDIYAHLP